MKIGLFFGSFNPIHIGHLILASHMVEYSDLDQVMFVVSPQSPFKKKANLLNEYDRLELARVATEDDDRLSVSDIEFKLAHPNYTVHTLLHLEERYPNHEFVLIMGTDTVNTLPKWKNYESLIERYSLYVYPRPENPLEGMEEAEIHHFNAPLMRISSSFIRESLKAGKSIRYLVPDPVLERIEKWGFYQNKI